MHLNGFYYISPQFLFWYFIARKKIDVAHLILLVLFGDLRVDVILKENAV